jgi:DNA-binding PadR family transcriptional regulator
MSLRHILLGLLDAPACGYELRREFGDSLKHFWAAELSQIYPTLSALERDGLVVSRQVPSPKGPARREYRRTDVGEEELEAWLQGEARVGTERLTWLAQVFFLGELHDNAAAARFLRRLRDAMAQRLEALQTVEATWRSEDPTYPDLPPERGLFKQMTLSLGLLRIAATIEWCDQSLARLERSPVPG